MRLVEVLSPLEKEMIVHYIEGNAFRGNNGRQISAPIDHILRLWDDAKGAYLYKMFGNQLILKRDIEYVKDKGELYDEMYNIVYNGVCSFCQKYLELVDSWYDNPTYRSIYYSMRDLINSDVLVENEYQGDPFSIPTPDGKEIKINRGSKAIRNLSKVAVAFGLEDFEEFRVKHSMVLNQKCLKGTLSLSIHPLDYMTMSDNECDWDSCMSWRDDGCYRQGTVEMMNSPMVVVAYLSAKEDMKLNWRDDEMWNNKKWRELFIVTPEIITNVKPYPYTNMDLTDNVLKWLRELADAYKLGDYCDTIEQWEYECQKCNDYMHDNGIDFSFETRYMYNDFESEHYQHSYFSKRLSGTTYICYSGESECMCCGSTDMDCYENEGCLVCDGCEGYCRCEYCESRMYDSDETYTVGGVTMCYSCYESHAFEDGYDGEMYLADDGCKEIYLGIDSKWFGKLRVREGGWYSDNRIASEECPGVYQEFYLRVCDDNYSEAIACWAEDAQVLHVSRRWSREAYIIPLDKATEDFAAALGYCNLKELVEQVSPKEYIDRHARILL